MVGSDYNFGLVESMAGMKLSREEYLNITCEGVRHAKKKHTGSHADETGGGGECRPADSSSGSAFE